MAAVIRQILQPIVIKYVAKNAFLSNLYIRQFHSHNISVSEVANVNNCSRVIATDYDG